MAIGRQEKRFLQGVGLVALATVLVLFGLPHLSSEDSAPPPRSPELPVSVVEPGAAPRRARDSAASAAAATGGGRPSGVALVAGDSEVPAQWPTAPLDPAALPPLLARYVERAGASARFAQRLRAIAERAPSVREERRRARPGLVVERGERQQVISFNVRTQHPYLGLRLPPGLAAGPRGDLLVDWVDSDSGERLKLSFVPAPLGGRLRLEPPGGGEPPPSRVYLYGSGEGLPLLAAGRWTP